MKRPLHQQLKAYHLPPRPGNQDFMWLSSSNTTTMDVMERLGSMRRLEATSYARRDYLNLCQKQQQHQEQQQEEEAETARITINKGQRQQMVYLLYEIADFCHFRRETVEYAVYNVMDRYLSHRIASTASTTPQTTADLQLIASASILIAVKVLEPVSMDVESLADLSGGAFGTPEVLAMEKTILFALQWNVAHGPTSIAFVQHLLALLSTDWEEGEEQDVDNTSDDGRELLDDLLEKAQYQVELAVVDYVLGAKHTMCDIALAAVWNVLESHLEDSDLAKYYQRRLWTYTIDVEGLYPSWKQQQRSLAKVQLTLCQIHYHATRRFQQESSSSEESESDSDTDQQKHLSRGTLPIKRRLPSRNCRSTSSTISAVTSSSSCGSRTNDVDHEPDTLGSTDDDDDTNDEFTTVGDWRDTSERTLPEDGDTSRMSTLFPSPTSVATNHLSAHGGTDASIHCGGKNTTHLDDDDDDGYDDEEEEDEERMYGYGLGFLQRWLFA